MMPKLSARGSNPLAVGPGDQPFDRSLVISGFDAPGEMGRDDTELSTKGPPTPGDEAPLRPSPAPRLPWPIGPPAGFADATITSDGAGAGFPSRSVASSSLGSAPCKGACPTYSTRTRESPLA